MKVQDLLGKLKETEVYKDFKNSNPDAFFCSAMFILEDTEKTDLNFFLPSQNKISTFSTPFTSVVNHQEEIKDQKEIKDLNLKVDIHNLKDVVKNKTGKNFSKIIAVFHNGNWNLTCLNGLDMSRVNIDAYSGEFGKKEEGNLMDMVRIKKK